MMELLVVSVYIVVSIGILAIAVIYLRSIGFESNKIMNITIDMGIIIWIWTSMIHCISSNFIIQWRYIYIYWLANLMLLLIPYFVEAIQNDFRLNP